MNSSLKEKYKDLIEALDNVLQEWENFKIKVNYDFYQNRSCLRTARPFQKELMDIFTIYAIEINLHSPVMKILKKILSKNYMINCLNGQGGLIPNSLVSRLIDEVIKDNSVEKTVKKLDKLLNTKSAKAFQVVVIFGVNCNESINLTNNIQLIPLENLPNSQTKEKLQESLLPNTHFRLGTIQNKIQFRPPQACLIQTANIEPFFYDKNKPYQPPSRKNLDEIILLLTVISSESPTVALSWPQFEDKDIDTLIPLWINLANDEISPLNPDYSVKELKPVDTKEVKKIVELYLKIPENTDTKGKLKIALNRLNIAKRRRFDGDKALEICIALEVLLADGQGENTFKIGLRAGLLLGGDLETRLHHRRIIGGVYSLRSSLVHDGKIGDKVKLVGVRKTDSKEVINEAIAITQLVIRKIIELGETPDWYQFELSGGNDSKELEETFNQLVRQWRTETREISSSTELILHPAYQQIIGLGKEAIPLLLRELEKKSGRWFWALKSITRQDPVLPEQQGKTKEMIQAWLDWGRKNGYQW